MDEFEISQPSYACCKHCVSDQLGCDRNDPGHAAPCMAPRCPGGKHR